MMNALAVIMGDFCAYIGKNVIVYDPKRGKGKSGGEHTSHLIPIDSKRLILTQVRILLKENKPQLDISKAKIVVLGYGNVASGAMQEFKSNSIQNFAVLGAAQTINTRIESWLQDADLIINGAELAKELRGKQYLVTNEHLKTIIKDGSVLIDIVGGSKTNPSAIEAVKTCTFLSAPHFVQNGITIAALFGWPMMGMMRESNLAYSQQITDVLIGKDQLIKGIEHLTAGVKPALVVGPYQV